MALPGMFTDLYKEREMENTYAKAIKEPENFIFVRDQGAAWDIFTIGVFRDLKHYAESADVTPADAAGRSQGRWFQRSQRYRPISTTVHTRAP